MNIRLSVSKAFAGVVASTLLFTGLVMPVSAAKDSYRAIVVFEEGTTDEERSVALPEKKHVVIKRLKKAIDADVVSDMTDEKAVELLQNPHVKRVDKDIEVTTLAQTLPWGVDRIDAEKAWGATSTTPVTGAGIRVAVVDTGIDLTHPDLAARIKGGVNTISSAKSYTDDNGHGTHVAGTIAAINNTVGVVGVAPLADIYAVKVLDRRGSGWLSDIIEGIDWSISHNIQVINMSLGSNSDVQSFHDAVTRAHNAGIVIVAAAGNDGGAVDYPAAYPEVITVSASNSSNAITSWSSRGSAVDLIAPGNSIYSTYKGRTYATLSGTSMATPHVAGAAALVLSRRGCIVRNTPGCTPAEIQSRLEATAKQVAPDTTAGKDSLYGAGLLDAQAAVGI